MSPSGATALDTSLNILPHSRVRGPNKIPCSKGSSIFLPPFRANNGRSNPATPAILSIPTLLLAVLHLPPFSLSTRQPQLRKPIPYSSQCARCPTGPLILVL